MANQSHKRETNARRKPKLLHVAAPVSVLATLAVVGVGVLGSDPAVKDVVSANQASIADHTKRDKTVSRSGADRGKPLKAKNLATSAGYAADAELKATRAAIKNASVKLWTTEELNLWDGPTDQATQHGTIDTEKKVLTTGREQNGRAEIVVDGQSRWVTADYLSDEKPVTSEGGVTMAPCPDSSVESGLTSSAVKVYRSVCNNFPQITSYGGWDGHGEHSSGRAIDIMTSDVELGTAIAEFLRAHASELNLYDVIWRQRIWTPVRASEGWRSMSSRGSATANHYDHVHVSVN